MCLMCGDDYKVDVPLSPLLNHQFHHVNKSPDDHTMTVTLETYLDEFKRKVEVLAMSYHSATQLKDFLYHGYLLVFSAKRKASLATLRYSLLLLLLQFRPAPLGVLSSAIRRHERAQRTVLGQVSDWFWARSVTGSGPGQ